MIFSIIDVKMFVIRVVVFFLVMSMFIGLFVSLKNITLNSGFERSVNELGEAMLSSEFTTTRAVFDLTKRATMNLPGLDAMSLTDLNNTEIEPLRLCGQFAYFEFFVKEIGGFAKVASFGLDQGLELARQEWTVWIVRGGKTEPGRMRIHLYKDALTGLVPELGFDELTCAIEQAWLYKKIVHVAYSRICPADYQCVISNEAGYVVLSQATYGSEIVKRRYLGVKMSLNDILIDSGNRDIDVIPIMDVPDAVRGCPPAKTPTTFQTNTDRQKSVSDVLVCDVTK